jgi:transposase-like protein
VIRKPSRRLTAPRGVKQCNSQGQTSCNSANDNLIGRWVTEFAADGVVSFPGNGKLKPDDLERRLLEKEIRDLKEENAFLKKTASYFASQKK